MLSRETFSILKNSKSLQTILAAETHLAVGRDLKLGQTWNRGKSLRCRVGTRRPTVSKIIIIIIIVNKNLRFN
jgi:hypothetical protein